MTERVQFSELSDPNRWTGCKVCGTPLFSVEAPIGKCRACALAGTVVVEQFAVPQQGGKWGLVPEHRIDRFVWLVRGSDTSARYVPKVVKNGYYTPEGLAASMIAELESQLEYGPTV